MLFILFYWSNPVNISNIQDAAMYLDADIDKYSNIHVVFQTKPDLDSCFLYYTRSTNGVWQDSGVIIWDPPDGHFGLQEPMIAVDTLGHPHILFCELLTDVASRLYYMYHDGSQWIGPMNLSDTFMHRSATCDIAIDESSNVHIVFDDYIEGEVYYSVKKNGRWEGAVNISNLPDNDDYFPVIAARNKKVYVLFYSHYSPYSKPLYFVEKRESGWSSPILVDDEYRSQGEEKGITIGKDGIPVITWLGTTSSPPKYYIFFSRYPFNTKELVVNEEGHMPKIYVDKCNLPHIIATFPPNSDPKLRIYSRTDEGWVAETLPTPNVKVPYRVVVMKDSIEKIHLVFRGEWPDYRNIDIYYMNEYDNTSIPEDEKRMTNVYYFDTIFINVDKDLKIYDLTGILVKEYKGKRDRISIGDIPAGVYLLKKDNERIKKIIILK